MVWQGTAWESEASGEGTELLIAEADTLSDCVSSVINELDGLAKGQETDHRAGGYARVVQEKARKSIEFLERRFESRDSCLRALTSRGNELESIAFRSEDITGQLVRRPSRKGVPTSSLQNRVSRREGLKEDQSTWACTQRASTVEAQEWEFPVSWIPLGTVKLS